MQKIRETQSTNADSSAINPTPHSRTHECCPQEAIHHAHTPTLVAVRNPPIRVNLGGIQGLEHEGPRSQDSSGVVERVRGFLLGVYRPAWDGVALTHVTGTLEGARDKA